MRTYKWRWSCRMQRIQFHRFPVKIHWWETVRCRLWTHMLTNYDKNLFLWFRVIVDLDRNTVSWFGNVTWALLVWFSLEQSFDSESKLFNCISPMTDEFVSVVKRFCHAHTFTMNKKTYQGLRFVIKKNAFTIKSKAHLNI